MILHTILLSKCLREGSGSGFYPETMPGSWHIYVFIEPPNLLILSLVKNVSKMYIFPLISLKQNTLRRNTYIVPWTLFDYKTQRNRTWQQLQSLPIRRNRLHYLLFQCCGSGIRCLFPLDPGWVKNQDPGSASGMNLPHHISEILHSLMACGSGSGNLFEARSGIRGGKNSVPGIFLMDPGWKKFRSSTSRIRNTLLFQSRLSVSWLINLKVHWQNKVYKLPAFLSVIGARPSKANSGNWKHYTVVPDHFVAIDDPR